MIFFPPQSFLFNRGPFSLESSVSLRFIFYIVVVGNIHKPSKVLPVGKNFLSLKSCVYFSLVFFIFKIIPRKAYPTGEI